MESFLLGRSSYHCCVMSPNHHGLKQLALITLHGVGKLGIQKQCGQAVPVQVSHAAGVGVLWKVPSRSSGLGRLVQLRAGTAGLLGCTFYLSVVSAQSLSNMAASGQLNFLHSGQGTKAGILREIERVSEPDGSHSTFCYLALEVCYLLLSLCTLLLGAVSGSSPS